VAKKIYKSEAMASIHQIMEGAFEIEAIDKKTMREFDETCLIPAPVPKPEEIKAIRESESVSQPVFADGCAQILFASLRRRQSLAT